MVSAGGVSLVHPPSPSPALPGRRPPLPCSRVCCRTSGPRPACLALRPSLLTLPLPTFFPLYPSCSSLCCFKVGVFFAPMLHGIIGEPRDTSGANGNGATCIIPHAMGTKCRAQRLSIPLASFFQGLAVVGSQMSFLFPQSFMPPIPAVGLLHPSKAGLARPSI